MPVWRRRAANGRRDTSFDAVRTKGSWGEAGRRRRSVGGAAAPGGGRRWMGGGLGLDSGGGVGRRWRGVFDIAPSFFFNLYPFVTFFYLFDR